MSPSVPKATNNAMPNTHLVKKEPAIFSPTRANTSSAKQRMTKAKKFVRILPAPEKKEPVLHSASTQKLAAGAQNVKSKMTKAHSQIYVNPCVTFNQNVTAAFPKSASAGTCITSHNQADGGATSVVAIPIAAVSSGIIIPQDALGNSVESDISHVSCENKFVAANHETPRNLIFVQPKVEPNAYAAVPQCEIADTKMQLTPGVQVKEAAIRSHFSPSRTKYIQPNPNIATNIGQAALPYQAPAAPIETIGQTNIQPAPIVQVHTMRAGEKHRTPNGLVKIEPRAIVNDPKGLAKNEPAEVAIEGAIDKVPQGISSDEGMKMAISQQGQLQLHPETPVSKENATEPFSSNRNIPPTRGSAIHTRPRQTPSIPGPSSADKEDLKVSPNHRFIPDEVIEDDTVEVRLPYGTIRTVKMTQDDMDRHIPVWNCKQNYKLAGTSAPLGRNLSAYLERKKGEFEIYSDQDTRSVRGTNESPRVTLWNKKELRKLSGTSAPLRKNLQKYLSRHPDCEVYNGQAERLDPSIKHMAHNRVTLWNTVTNRRTGFGSAGPLRKNLPSYLRRNPHLEEYTGQDKVQNAEAPVATNAGTQHPKAVTGADTAGSSSMPDEDCNRWHAQRSSGEKSCDSSCGEEAVQEDPDNSQTVSPDGITASPQRLCENEPSGLSDHEVNELPETPTKGDADSPEWYETFYEAGLEDGMDDQGIEHAVMDTIDSQETRERETVPEIREEDRMDIDADEYVTSSVSPPASPRKEVGRFNPDDFLNFGGE